MGILVDAAVFHDDNVFDPVHATIEASGVRLESILDGSPFIAALRREGALAQCRDLDEVAFSPSEPDDGEDELAPPLRKGRLPLRRQVDISVRSLHRHPIGDALSRAITYLGRHVPNVFDARDLLDSDDRGAIAESHFLLSQGVLEQNLVAIEGHNHRMDALLRLALAEDLHLDANEVSLVNRIGMAKRRNSRVRTLIESMTAKLPRDLDETSRDVSAVAIPELTRTVLLNAKGTAAPSPTRSWPCVSSTRRFAVT